MQIMSDPIRYGWRENRRLRRLRERQSVPKPDEAPVRFFRFSYFIWLLALGGIVYMVIQLGLPALRWQYTYQGSDSHRYYVRCDYLSFHNGAERVVPSNGRCPFIALRPLTF